MTDDPLDIAFQRLEDGGYRPKRRGEKLLAHCPAHDDSTPSLGVSRGTSQPLILKCMGGCQPVDVLRALNLTWADISAPRERVEHTTTARYQYRDENGELVYTVERIEPGYDGKTKSFKQVPANGKTGPGSMKGVRRLPYRLPAIIQAVAAGKAIWIAEGEKDVETLVKAGIEATTNSGGADGWDPAWNVWLSGAQVAIVVDRDIAGYRRGLTLLQQLRHVTRNVVVLEPIDGKDITDHLQAGRELGELEKLSEGALISNIRRLETVETAADNPIEPGGVRLDQYLINWDTIWQADSGPEWLIEPFVARGRAHSLYAGAKTGKSLLTLYAVASAALGEATFGLPFSAGTPIKTLYVDMEMTADDLLERLADMGWDGQAFPNLHYLQLPNLRALDTPEGGLELVEYAIQLGVELVVIDTTSRVIAGEENSADTFRFLYMHTIQPLKGAGIASLRLDHSGKDVTKGTRGSSAKSDDVDVVFRLDKTDEGFNLVATHRRMGWVPETTPLTMRDEPLRYTVGIQSTPDGTKELIELLDRLRVPVDASVRTAAAALRDAGHKARQSLVSAALKSRRRHPSPGRQSVDDDLI